MKLFIGLTIAGIIWFASAAEANTITINLGIMSFTPDTVNVAVGDTVKWQWTTGIHTTTSTTIPAGALSWTSPMDVSHTTFFYHVTVAGVYNYQCNIHALMGMVGVINANPIGILPVSGNIPAVFSLSQNFPNPFNPVTNINFDIPQKSFINMNIYDVKGTVVSKLVSEELNAGKYKVDWDGTNFPSGAYFIRFSSDKGFTKSIKMILLK